MTLHKQSRFWLGYLKLADALDRPSRLDGRLVILLCLIVYFGALARCISVFHNEQGCWLCLGTPEPLPFPAGDLVILPPTVRSMDEGTDPYYASPYDPMFRIQHYPRAFNYPRIWLLLPRLGLTEANAGTWRFVVSAIFFLTALSLFETMNWFSGLLAAAAICSPNVMFAVERGNADQWIFIALAAAVLCFQRGTAWAGYGLLWFAAILKLYPALSFLAVLRERTWKRRAVIASVLVVTFAAYLFWIRADLRSIARTTPHDHHLAFGREVFFLLIRKWALHGSAAMDRWLSLASFTALLGCIGIAYGAASRLRSQLPPPASKDRPTLTAFRIGGIIFAGVFCVATSYNYRLIFLLFTVPQMLSWAGSRNAWGAISGGAFVVLLATLWPPPNWSGLHPLIVWVLFTYVTTALILTLPENVSYLLFRKRPMLQSRGAAM